MANALSPLCVSLDFGTTRREAFEYLKACDGIYLKRSVRVRVKSNKYNFKIHSKSHVELVQRCKNWCDMFTF